MDIVGEFHAWRTFGMPIGKPKRWFPMLLIGGMPSSWTSLARLPQVACRTY
jgi:hypothetical protein